MSLSRRLVAGVALAGSLSGWWTTASPARAADGPEVPAAVLQAEQTRIAAIAKASRSAVAVFERGGQGGGSGVVITKDGYALTNYHVTQPCGEYMKCSMNDGKLYDAVIVGIDPTGDVALIKLLGREDFPPAEIADSDTVRVGDWCFAVGNPFLLATDFQPTISYGIVSGTHRYQYPAGTILEYADCIQTDAAINPGNSGGPLFNAQGQLIGINGRGSFEKRGRVNVGVGYAISINQINHFLGHLHSGRVVDHATLGATVATDDSGRVVVTNILETSDAYRRGLRYGDEIVSFGGRSIGSTNTFKNVLGIFPKGWRVPLTYRREGERREITVRLAGVHTDEELAKLLERRPAPKQQRPKGKDGKPGKPGDDPQPMPPKPDEQTPPGHPPVTEKAPIPEAAAKWIKKRTGYVNYHFNELNRDRVWKSVVAKGDFSGTGAEWVLTGDLENAGPIEIRLGEKELSASLPAGAARVDLSKDLDDQLDPPQSGGLLVALHLWQRLLRVGPEKFGDLYYLGRLPVVGRPAPCDALVGIHQVMEARFLVDPETGLLASVESYADVQDDPCELRFNDYRDVGGRQVPHTIEVRHGDRLFGVLKLKTVGLAPAEKK